MRKWIVVGFILLVVAFWWQGKPNSITSLEPLLSIEGLQDITPAEVMAKLEAGEDLVLIDVRTPLEFEQGYIEGALLIPSYELEKIEALGISKDKEIILYCATGGRSTRAGNTLADLGYTRVYNLKGGIQDWIKIGGAVITEESTAQEGPSLPSETLMPETTSPPVTTQPPEVEPTPTTSPTTTRPPATITPPATTSAPAAYWTDEPVKVIQAFTGSKTITMNHYDTIQVGNALVYLEFDIEGPGGSCFPISAWILTIFEATDKGGILEGSVLYTLDSITTPQDITSNVHKQTDALDDYTIIVDEWPQEKIKLTLTRR